MQATSPFKSRVRIYLCKARPCKHLLESILLVTLGRFSELGKT